MNIFLRLSRWSLPVFALVLLGQGCLGGQQTAQGPDGGVFETTTGETWTQQSVLNLGTKLGSIANVGIASLAVDPEDNNAIYAGTVENGILYSLDGGKSWSNPEALKSGRVDGIAIHPKSKCTIFALRANQIMKTENCNRDWTQVFFNPRTDTKFTSIFIDWFNPAIMYVSTDDGDILKSENNGMTWRVVDRVDGVRMNNIAMDPKDSRTVYVSSFGQGILKTTDGGENWTQIRDELNTFDGARKTTAVILDSNQANRVYHLSKYGVLLSDDAGATWQSVALPSPTNSIDLTAFAVHPKDSKKLVYATDNSVVFSSDGGLTWTSQKLPTTRSAAVLLYTPADPPTLYLGSAAAKKK